MSMEKWPNIEHIYFYAWSEKFITVVVTSVNMSVALIHFLMMAIVITH